MAFDVIVVGIGGMGSAAAWQLARRGLRVLGLERFDIPHAMGSSHGVTRIIRLPYYEDPAYVPLLRRAYELWRAIEAESGEELLIITGSLDGGPEEGALFQGALASARLHDLPHEVLTAAQVRDRFPAYRLPAGTRLVFQPQGGFVASERAIVAHVRAAQAKGAEIRARERVLDWEAASGNGGVVVTTDRGRYEAERLVLTAGAWVGELAAPLARLAVSGAAGPRLAATVSARMVPPGPVPGLQPRGRGGPVLRPAGLTRCRASSSDGIITWARRAARRRCAASPTRPTRRCCGISRSATSRPGAVRRWP